MWPTLHAVLLSALLSSSTAFLRYSVPSPSFQLQRQGFDTKLFTKIIPFRDGKRPNQIELVEVPDDYTTQVFCGPDEPLHPYLTKYKPLSASVLWIYMVGPNHYILPETNEKLWEEGKWWLQNLGDKVTLDDAKLVAKKSNMTTGKWKIQVHSDQVDGLWSKVASAMHAGELPAANCCKVATALGNRLRQLGSVHTINVYVNDFLDRDNVEQLHKELTASISKDAANEEGHVPVIAGFKPDIFSSMSWYRGQMPPSIPGFLYSDIHEPTPIDVNEEP